MAKENKEGKRKVRFNIRMKLLIYFLVISTIQLTITAVVSSMLLTTNYTTDKLHQLNGIADNKAHLVETWFEERRGDVQFLSGVDMVINRLLIIEGGATGVELDQAVADLNELFEEMEEIYGTFSEILALNTEGILLTSHIAHDYTGYNHEEHIGQDYSGKEYFVPCRNKIDTSFNYLTDFHRRDDGVTVALQVSSPVVSDDLEFLGAIVMYINVEAINDVMHFAVGLGETGETYLVDHEGYWLTTSKFDYYTTETGLYNDVHEIVLDAQISTEGFVECMAARDIVMKENNLNYQGVPVMGVYEYLEINDQGQAWVMVCEEDVEEALAVPNLLTAISIVLMVVIGGVVAVLAFIIARQISKPVSQLANIANEIAQGKLQEHKRLRAIRKPNDEIGVLIYSFDNMVEHLIEVINKQRKTTLKLKKSQNLFLTTLKSIGDAVITTDKSGVVTFLNKVATSLTGWKLEEALEKPIEEIFIIINEETRKPVKNPAVRVLEEGIIVGLANHSVLIAKDGMEIPIDDSGAPIKDDEGNILGVVLIFRDITERREAEEAIRKAEKSRQEKLVMLGQLAGGVGHELRNPLGAIKNATYFLKMVLEETEPEIKETLEVLDKEINTSEMIINSLLGFARPKPPLFQKVNVNTFLQEILARAVVPENIKIKKESDENLPIITGDPDQLSHVFGNIILNAIQAMGEGGQLTIRTEVLRSEWVSVSISDTGIGISKENMKKLFEPMFTTKAKGIGLGLAIARIMVEGHRGIIKAQSEVGKGSTFTIELPISGKGES